ncbi:unnamed protein product [marine sediment metagenome]|uniref:Uncharacterized protein n=1 Tax=marine sediment metagenome TaxID=412755 RepID=X0WI86_9ZZZZ
MSEITTYTCDRCEATSERIEFLEAVSVLVGTIRAYSHPSPEHRAEWCRPCLIEMGLRRPADHLKEDPPAPEPPPTLEEVLRELIREVVQEETDTC